MPLRKVIGTVVIIIVYRFCTFRFLSDINMTYRTNFLTSPCYKLTKSEFKRLKTLRTL